MAATVVDDIRNLAIQPRWEASGDPGYSVGVVEPAVGLFAGWRLKCQVQQTDRGWAVFIDFWPPAGGPWPAHRMPADIVCALPGGAVFESEADARRVLWVAATGDDRKMPGLMCRPAGSAASSGVAGLRGLVLDNMHGRG